MWSIWIKSYSSLKDSIKTKRVARRLNITVPQVIGHLHMLWWWVMEQAETGDISHVDAWEVEEVMCWNGEEGALFSAMVEFGFVDDDGQSRSIHDWQDYSGSVLSQRDKNREKLARFRERQKQQSSNENNETVLKRLRNGFETVTKRDREEKSREEKNKRREDSPPTPPQGGSAAPESGEASVAAPAPELPEDTATVTRVIKAWNDQLAGYGFPEASKSTPKREKAFDARLNERSERRSLLWWQEVFRRMASSAFMRDEAKRKAGWLCFDWILKEDNLVKVCEGKYDDREKPAQRDKSYEEAAAEYYASL